MKTTFKLLPLAAMLLLCAPAHAQLGNLLNQAKQKAKNAVRQEVSRATQQATGAAINALEGNAQGNNQNNSQSNNQETQSSFVSEQNSNAASVSKTPIPEGPAVPELMKLTPSWNQYDATGMQIANFAWGLRKASNDEMRELAEQLTARAKYDRSILAGLEDGTYEMEYEEKYELKTRLENELANWSALYSELGEITSLLFSAEFKQDEHGLWYYEGNQLFIVGMHMTNIPASEEGIVGNRTTLFTSRDNKAFFCTSDYQPKVANSDEIAMAKRDQNLMTNIAILFEGYPVDYCMTTQPGVMAKEYAQYYNRALSYSSTVKMAIDNNSPDNLEFKPMPKAGALNASLKSQALTAEKVKKTDLVDVVITSDSWKVETNALGTPIRRVIYGYAIVKTEYGKMANRVSWAEDYQGGSYGKLHAYGVGAGGSFYVK